MSAREAARHICIASFAASCGGRQSAVDAAGVQAGQLESLWWLFFYVTAAVYVIVMAVLMAAFIRRQRSTNETPPDTETITPARTNVQPMS